MPRNTSFSIGAIRVNNYDTGALVGQVIRPMSLEVPLTRAVIQTRGGASQWATAARQGAVETEGKLSVNESLPWLTAIATGGELGSDDLVADRVDSFTNLVGSTVSANFSLAATAGATLFDGEVFVTYLGAGTAANSARVRVHISSSNGVCEAEYDNVGTGANAQALPVVGTTLDYSDTSTLAAGDQGVAKISVAGTRKTVTLGSALSSKNYGLTAWTYGGGLNDDTVDEITIPALVWGGATPKAADNEATSGMEFSFVIVDKLDGTAPFSYIQGARS